jgi:hypothetical protein
VNIDRKLNLVIPLERADGGDLYVYSIPMRREVWEHFFMVLAKTFTVIYQGQLGWMSGPRVAGLLLREVAQTTMRADGSSSWWEGDDGVEMSLLPEMRRLTSVLVPEGGVWRQVLLDDAVDKKLLTDDEVAEVTGALAFFTVNSAMHKPKVLAAMLNAAAGVWGWQITSSTLSEFRSSLTTSTTDDAILTKGTPLQVPS